MSVPDEQFIRVLWAPPISQSEVSNHAYSGLYQIYGHHVVFGPGSLLYVGKADNLAERFAGHSAWLRFESDVQIRLGDLGNHKDWLGHVEALTIYWHSPPYNSHFIAGYGKRPPIRVQNHGDRGRLLPEYSSHWTAPRPDDEEGRAT